MKATNKDSISDKILATLDAADGYLEDYLYYTHIYKKGYKPVKKVSFDQSLRRLGKKGLIKWEETDNKILIKLTEIGRDYLFLYRRSEKEWDGKWRMVIFDIPEQKRLIRNMFRRNLKKWGFKQLQKSVWASKRDVYSKLVGYTQDLGIAKWVIIVESAKVSGKV